jgi:rare lipoprotein A
MRLPVEIFARHTRVGLALILSAALVGCAAAGGDSANFRTAALDASGPAADYPVVVGEPYRVGDTLYTPLDTFNYDEVGYAAADTGSGISASHHSLPLPSYAEVTSLESGRTILVRVERRGPLDGDALIALAPAALEQLGAGAGEPVRVRRVNPPEDERAFLRAGRSAPLRMDTPEALLTVLQRKLPQNGGALPVQSAAPAALAQVELPPSTAAANLPPVQSPATAQATPLPSFPSSAAAESTGQKAPVVVARLEQPEPAQQAEAPDPPKQQEALQAATTPTGAYVVQAVALSSRERAQRVASAIGGSVSQAGKFYRVRTGPFATHSQAEASLAKVRAAGYSDARIFTNS